MALYEEVKTLSSLTRFRGVLQNFSDALIQQVSASTANTACSNADADNCRDDAESLKLKLVAVVLILMTGVAGIAIPLVGRKRRFLRTDSSAFVLIKAFAAGVILATGFVHMLPDGQEALDNSCLPSHPWSDFPFPGFIAMMASLGTLVLDFLGTQFYARKHKEHGNSKIAPNPCVPELIEDSNVGILISSGTEVEELVSAASSGCKHEESMHIVGMYAHAAAHRHSHPHPHGHSENAASSATQSAHSGHYEENESSLARHAVISQILELGIVSHSIIIGLSLGVSRSPCTIRPLMGALSFHQFFEGFALGGCISQAQFGAKVATTMACFFAITTPSGIAVGAALSSFYNPNSPRALIVEGVLDSISAGILIYMALVDLIGADFLSRSMSCSSKLQALSYVALFLGALSMALLALWA